MPFGGKQGNQGYLWNVLSPSWCVPAFLVAMLCVRPIRCTGDSQSILANANKRHFPCSIAMA
eukprot:466179-Pyramimonas_sp.AAC.1